MRKKQFSFRATEEEMQKLKSEAKKNGRSITAHLIYCVLNFNKKTQA